MGIEYIARYAPLDAAAVDDLRQRIVTLDGLEPVPVSPLYPGLHLRYRDEPLNGGWSEAIVIDVAADRCYVLFHLGHGRQDRLVLDAVATLFLATGRKLTFEEL